MNSASLLLFKNVFISFYYFLKFIHLLFLGERDRKRKREGVSRGGAEREGGTESEAGSGL